MKPVTPKRGRKSLPKSEKKMALTIYVRSKDVSALGGAINVRQIMTNHVNYKIKQLC